MRRGQGAGTPSGTVCGKYPELEVGRHTDPRRSSTLNRIGCLITKTGTTKTSSLHLPLQPYRDKIVSEIKAQGWEFVIQKQPDIPIDISDRELKLVKSKVRNFIVKHLDEVHQSIVRQDIEPKKGPWSLHLSSGWVQWAPEPRRHGNTPWAQPNNEK